jgi:hypothetical protein
MAGGVVVNTGGGKDYPGKLTMFVLLACIVAATGGLIFGYDIGISGKPDISLLRFIFFFSIFFFFKKNMAVIKRARKKCTLCLHLARCCSVLVNQGNQGIFLGLSSPTVLPDIPTHDFTHTNKTAIFPSFSLFHSPKSLQSQEESFHASPSLLAINQKYYYIRSFLQKIRIFLQAKPVPKKRKILTFCNGDQVA